MYSYPADSIVVGYLRVSIWLNWHGLIATCWHFRLYVTLIIKPCFFVVYSCFGLSLTLHADNLWSVLPHQCHLPSICAKDEFTISLFILLFLFSLLLLLLLFSLLQLLLLQLFCFNALLNGWLLSTSLALVVCFGYWLFPSDGCTLIVPRITYTYALSYVHNIFWLCWWKKRLGIVEGLSLLFYSTIQYCYIKYSR